MNDWCPGAVQSPQPGGVTLDRTLPPRVVWHITWDALTNGVQPQFSAVSNYLKSVEYCPTLMWNPFTGYIEQFYPASVGGRALKYNNQDGAACIQIEVFFTPGCVVNGKTYNTVAETPCVGLDTILAWTDSLGIPRVWPMGAPQWSGNSRDVTTWNGNAGHYGHCNSPGDDHTDPGPMPSLNIGSAAIAPQSTTTTPKDWFDMATADDLRSIIQAEVGRAVWGYKNPTLERDDAYALLRATRTYAVNTANLPAAVLNQTFKLADGTVTNLAGILTAIHATPAAPGTVADPLAVVHALRDQLNK